MNFNSIDILNVEEVNNQFNDLIENDNDLISGIGFYIVCDNGNKGSFYTPEDRCSGYGSVYGAEYYCPSYYKYAWCRVCGAGQYGIATVSVCR